jgi:hypothetical protein
MNSNAFAPLPEAPITKGESAGNEGRGPPTLPAQFETLAVARGVHRQTLADRVVS